jgi:hypothetical protein
LAILVRQQEVEVLLEIDAIEHHLDRFDQHAEWKVCSTAITQRRQVVWRQRIGGWRW